MILKDRSAWLLEHTLPAILVLLCLILGLLNPVFLGPANLSNVLLQGTIITILSVGMTFVIIAGGIDLSVGSVVAFCGILIGLMLQTGIPSGAAIVLALLAGAACGTLSGLLIGFGNIPPFIATLGMFGSVRGLALMLSNGRSISGFDEGFLSIAAGHVFAVPLPVLVMGVVLLAAYLFLRFTYWGVRIYAIGGNPRAAWLSGIPVPMYQIGIYAFTGFLAGLSSVLLTSRLNSALPTAGNGYEMDAIAAAVIGGAALSGGRGSVVGTLFGSLILAVLKNGLTLLDISSYFQQIVSGLIVVLAVLSDSRRLKRSFS